MVRTTHAPIQYGPGFGVSSAPCWPNTGVHQATLLTSAYLYEESTEPNARLLSDDFVPRSVPRRGPDSMGTRFQWARHVWEKLDPDEKDRLIRNMARLECSSHFTGLGSFESIIFHIWHEINSHMLHPVPPVQTVHCCDKDTSRQRVLTSYKEKHKPLHVHGDILDRLTEEQKTELKKLLPHDHARRCERRASNKAVREYLFKIFKDGSVREDSFCAIHGMRCKCFSRVATAFHSDDSDPENDIDRLTFHAAGVICKDASNEGLRAGDSGPYMHLQHAWTAERRVRREDAIIVECTPRWEANSVLLHMPSTYYGYTNLLASNDFAELVRRIRRQLSMWNQERARCRCASCYIVSSVSSASCVLRYRMCVCVCMWSCFD